MYGRHLLRVVNSELFNIGISQGFLQSIPLYTSPRNVKVLDLIVHCVISNVTDRVVGTSNLMYVLYITLDVLNIGKQLLQKSY